MGSREGLLDREVEDSVVKVVMGLKAPGFKFPLIWPGFKGCGQSLKYLTRISHCSPAVNGDLIVAVEPVLTSLDKQGYASMTSGVKSAVYTLDISL